MRLCPKRIPPLAAWFGLLFATTASWVGEARAEALKTVQVSTLAQQIASAQQLVSACAASAGACDGSALPDAEVVEGSPAGTFHLTWQWLRDDLLAGKTATSAERAKKMKAAQAHLETLVAQAEARPSLSPAAFRAARAAAKSVLERPEFRASVDGPTWTERLVARLQDWFFRLFTGVDRVGRRAPWLAPLIEWGCFALAVAGLLWFVRQSLARQALRITLSEGVALAGSGERDAADWTRMAEERAAAHDWREAVHCFYWAAIALLESRRAWRPNATRTPREYLRLLKPGTEAHGALGDLTRSFERVWYGQQAAVRDQYLDSLKSFRALEASRPERAAVASPGLGEALPAVRGA